MITYGQDQPLDLSTKRNSTASSLSLESVEIVHLLTRDKTRRHPCLSCGIGFSSLKTLHAHEQFYCAKKPPKTDDHTHPPPQLRDTTETPKSSLPDIPMISLPQTKPQELESSLATALSSAGSSSISEATTATTKDKTGQFCPYCAFRGNTLRGLRSHITKYHLKDGKSTGKEYAPKKSGPTRPSVIVPAKRPKIDGMPGGNAAAPAGVTEKKKYCKYCDIYFKYLSTFLAHRKFYCTVRKPETAEAASSSSEPKT